MALHLVSDSRRRIEGRKNHRKDKKIFACRKEEASKSTDRGWGSSATPSLLESSQPGEAPPNKHQYENEDDEAECRRIAQVEPVSLNPAGQREGATGSDQNSSDESKESEEFTTYPNERPFETEKKNQYDDDKVKKI